MRRRGRNVQDIQVGGVVRVALGRHALGVREDGRGEAVISRECRTGLLIFYLQEGSGVS